MGKLDYAYLEYTLPYEYVNRTLYVMFRAVNFTLMEQKAEECENVYMEIEYRERDRKKECEDVSEEVRMEGGVIKVDKQGYSNKKMEQAVYAVKNNYHTFFQH